MAARFNAHGINTISEFLNADPSELAQKLDLSYVPTVKLSDWQDQARLVCLIPEIWGHDAQILVGCGYRKAADIAHLDPDQLLSEALTYCGSAQGKREVRLSRLPDLDEVTEWIRFAGLAATDRAA